MKKKTKKGAKRRPAAPPIPRTYEAVVMVGLEDIARRELTTILKKELTLHRSTPATPEGVIRFTYSGSPYALLRLKTIQAIYLAQQFDVARPRALLGNENFHTLHQEINAILGLHPDYAFGTFFISAAGSQSTILQRLKTEIAAATGLTAGVDEGDLHLRLRPSPGQQTGWEILLRLSPRPLATRPWRVCNMEGALNATVAHAMALMTDPMPYDTYLNLGCGSGTLLVERLACAPARKIMGCDISHEALYCAQANIEAAGYLDAINLHDWDACDLPMAAGSIDALTIDLPFGHMVGSHETNKTLYPAIMAEAARVAKKGALFALITHEIRLMQAIIEENTRWQVITENKIALGGLNPRIFVLKRLAE
ncbi:methyltransferase domain-containing protein [Chloroflexota bacterium]